MGYLLFAWLTALAFSNILIHGVGLKLLFILYKNDDRVQTLLLIHLCATEIFGSICWFLLDVLQMIKMSSPSNLVHITGEYICIMTSSTFLFVYYMMMVYVMVEKLLDIRLDLKYHLYCSVKKINNLMSLTWFIGWMLCITVIMVNKVGGVNVYMSMLKFIYPTFDIVVLVAIISCYGYVFIKYKQKIKADQARLKCRTSTFNIIVKSRFRMTFFRVLSFFGLVMLPDLVYLISVLKHNALKTPSPSLLILYNISFFCDAVMYIFMHPEVGKLMKKKLMGSLYGTACDRGSVVEGLKRNINLKYGADLKRISMRNLKYGLNSVVKTRIRGNAVTSLVV